MPSTPKETGSASKVAELSQLPSRPKATEPQSAEETKRKMDDYRRRLREEQERKAQEAEEKTFAAKVATSTKAPSASESSTSQNSIPASPAKVTQASPAPERPSKTPQAAKEKKPALPFFLRALGYYDTKLDGPPKAADKWDHDYKWTRCYHAYLPYPREFGEVRRLEFLHELYAEQQKKKDQEGKESDKEPGGEEKQPAADEPEATAQLPSELTTTITPSPGLEEGTADLEEGSVMVAFSEDGEYYTTDNYHYFHGDWEYVIDPDFIRGVRELEDDDVPKVLRRIVLGKLMWTTLDKVINSSRAYSRNALTEEEFKNWKDYYADIVKVQKDPERFEEALTQPQAIPYMREWLNNVLLWIMAIDQRWDVNAVDAIFKALKVDFLSLIFPGYSTDGRMGFYTVEVNMTKDRFREHEEEVKKKALEEAKKGKVAAKEDNRLESLAKKVVKGTKEAVDNAKKVVG